ncbi:MAG: ribosomal RNA small subunit methyltransferase A [Bacteroidetes bacterium]|nr:ribosomal RNA small subunit methyltransferase A [Bacteroidota bacterium]
MRTAPYSPKKSLGQHFLHDGNIARNIVAQLDPQPEDHVLEVGPGPGVLTRILAASGCHLIAADIDARAVEALRDVFPPGQHPRVELRHADILRVDPTALLPPDGTKLRVIGNLPYNITSQILFRLFDFHNAVSDAVVMMQREVAERILAAEGNKEYGILSVITQTHAAVRRCFHVSPNVFTPKPKVWSTVLHLRFEQTRLAKIRNYSFFRRLVKATFGQRRKTLSNSLRQLGISRDDINGEATAFLSLRPEQLAITDFITLSNLIDHLGGDAGRAEQGEDDGTRKK